MKIFFFLSFFTVYQLIIAIVDDPFINGLNIEFTGKSTVKTPLYIHGINIGKYKKNSFALEVMQKDLLFLDQFDISTVYSSKILTKEERKKLSDIGYIFALFIIDNSKTVDVYIHDLITDKTITGTRISKNKSKRLTAHKVADLVVKGLTGQAGFFSTYIAYTKEKLTLSRSHITTKQLCIAEYDGSHEHVLIDRPDLIFGLRWHNRLHYPLLFYSQHTKTNVQLRSVNQFKDVQLISDADGITMSPTCMPDNKGIIISATGNNGFAQLYHHTLQGTAQLTSYEGNSIAPCFSDTDNILYFCSDFKNNSPHIFAYDMNTKKVEQITKEGYCTSPMVTYDGNIVAYTKLIKGIMQLFLYDTHTKTHCQLTFDDANKDSFSWSPCGTYILYTESKKSSQRLTLLNIITGSKKYISSPEFRCSCPAWSPVYKDFALV